MALIQYDFVRRHTHRGRTMWGHRERVAIHGPRREASEEANPASTLI